MRTLKLLMVAFQLNCQWFEVSTSRDMLQPSNPSKRRYQQDDGRHAMLNDDLNMVKRKKTKKNQTTNKMDCIN